jgi:hypothetical protein
MDEPVKFSKKNSYRTSHKRAHDVLIPCRCYVGYTIVMRGANNSSLLIVGKMVLLPGLGVGSKAILLDCWATRLADVRPHSKAPAWHLQGEGKTTPQGHKKGSKWH